MIPPKPCSEVKAGRVEFKLDKNGNVAVPVGKFSFEEKALVENGNAVIEAVVTARPATAKGRFLEGMTLSATMSPGIHVDPSLPLSGSPSNLYETRKSQHRFRSFRKTQRLAVRPGDRLSADERRSVWRSAESARARGAELHVVKNSFLKRAMTDSGLPDVAGQADRADRDRDRRKGCGADRENFEDVCGGIQNRGAEDRV